MANNMSNVIRETTRMLFCSRHWSGESYLVHFYAFTVFFCVILTITATLENSVILSALHKDKSLHPPSKLLLRCLTVTDLSVGVIGQPAAINLLLSAIKENRKLLTFKYLAYVTTTICSGVSFVTLTAIGVDRLLALLLGSRYRQVVTVKRVRTIIFLFWLKSSMVGIFYVFDVTVYFISSAVLVMLEVVIATYSYARIFCTTRLQQTQVQDTFGSQRPSMLPNMGRYKKTVINALWAQLTLATYHLPFAVIMTVSAVGGLSQSLFLADAMAVCLVCLNSSLNPVLYCWKIKELRQAVKEPLRRFWACLST